MKKSKNIRMRTKRSRKKERQMLYYVMKVMISSVLIVLISETAKRSTFMGALFASLPFVSIFAICWLYLDNQNTNEIKDLSYSVFWLVLPSLAFFLLLPVLLGRNVNFYLAMIISMGVTTGLYFLLISILGRFGIKL